MLDRTSLEAAASLIYRTMPATPQYAWPLLGARAECEVWVKHENHTPTGAFKVRGGMVYVESLLRSGPRPAGIITATRGNHGQSLAFAGRCAGIPITVVVPHGNSLEKNAAMRAFGAELIEFGRDFDEARDEAVRLASSRGLHMVRRFIRNSFEEWRRTRWSCFRRWRGSTDCTFRSDWDRGSAELSALGICLGCARKCRRGFGQGRCICTELRTGAGGDHGFRRHRCRRNGLPDSSAGCAASHSPWSSQDCSCLR